MAPGARGCMVLASLKARSAPLEEVGHRLAWAFQAAHGVLSSIFLCVRFGPPVARRADPAVGERARVGLAAVFIAGEQLRAAAAARGRARRRKYRRALPRNRRAPRRGRATTVGRRPARHRARLHGGGDAGAGDRIGEAGGVAGQQHGGIAELADRAQPPADRNGAAGQRPAIGADAPLGRPAVAAARASIAFSPRRVLLSSSAPSTLMPMPTLATAPLGNSQP